MSALAAGCGGDADVEIPNGAGPTTEVVPSTPPPSTVCAASVVIRPAAPVADARARKAMPIAVDLTDQGGMRGPHPLKVVLSRGGAAIETLFEGAPDPGTVDLELDPSKTADLETGRYALEATAGCPSDATSSTPGAATTPLFIARLGVTSIDVKPGDGARVELMYHAVNDEYDNLYPISDAIAATLAIATGEPELDDKGGKLRAFAKPWEDVGSPPVDAGGAVIEDGVTLPVSLRVGTRPDLVFAVGKSAMGKSGPQSTGLEAEGAPPVRLVVDGTPGVDSAVVVPGQSVTVRLAKTPVPAVARVDLPIVWRFEAKTPQGTWAEVVGADASATLRIYGVLGNAQGTSAPDLPWVAVVDDATRAIAGGAKDANAVRALLVGHVYEKMGLEYDRVAGASHYSTYPAGFGGGSRFRLARFLARDMGKIVNCTDCANILSTYANMLGAELKYAIIDSLDLNPILGIGATEFGSPFRSGRMAFSYHAVTSADSASTVYDATLAVDGDADPSQAPFMKRLVQGISGAEYLQRLSPDTNVEYTHVAKPIFLSF